MWSNYSDSNKLMAREVINAKPINETYKKTLNIDTRFRENYYKTESTNFHISLPIRIKGVTQMKLCSLELPLTINNISATLGNNYFYIETTKVTIPNGAYDTTLLQTELNTQLPTGYTASVDDRTKRCVISKDDGTAFKLTFKTSNETNLHYGLGWILGYRFGIYQGNSSYVSEAPFIMKSPRYLFLCVDDYNNTYRESLISAFNSSISTNNILAKISIAHDFDENIFMATLEDKFVSGCKTRTYTGPVDIEKLKIQLIDEYGRIVNINGSDFSFSLEFECN